MRRILVVALPLCLALALVLVLFAQARSWQQKRLALELERRSETLAHAVTQNLHVHLESLHMIEGFYAGFTLVLPGG